MTSASSPPALSPEQVLSLLREHQSEWRERYQASAGSDVDVWLELDPLTPFAMVHLKHELEQLLQRPIDRVRLRERMNPALRNAILEEGICA